MSFQDVRNAWQGSPSGPFAGIPLVMDDSTLPLVIAGHNEQVAWGFTNGFPDVQDLYMEHLRQTPDGRTEYEFRGEWLEAEVKREEIKIREADAVIEEVVITRHGPIINSLIEREGMEVPLALRWTALERSNTTRTLINMNRASTCETFREALRAGCIPPRTSFMLTARETLDIPTLETFPSAPKGMERFPRQAGQASTSGRISWPVASVYRDVVRPSWSPDSKLIGFGDARQVGTKCTTDIFYVDLADIGPPVNVSRTDSTRALENSPAWNPAWVNDSR